MRMGGGATTMIGPQRVVLDRGDDDVADWPDRDVDWEYPDNTEANRVRWQSSIDAALDAGTLTLTPDPKRSAVWLEGSCPRCDHRLRQRIRYNVIRSITRGRRIKTNVDCACNSPHAGRDETNQGCGWGGPLAVELVVPGAG